MNKQNIKKEDIIKIFDSTQSQVRIDRALNLLNQFIRQDNNLPHIVNNMVNYLNEKKNNNMQTIAEAWLVELNKVLKETKVWNSSSTARNRIAARTLPTSGVLDLVKLHYYNKTEMPFNENEISNFMERELTEQEKINIRMAKMREAKRLKAEERKRLEKLEAAKKRKAKEQKEMAKRLTQQNKENTQKESGEASELDAELEYLKNLNF